MSPTRSARRVVLQGALATVGAAGLCLALWPLAPSTLEVRTPIVGTPTFTDFDFARYFDAYDLIAMVFPVLVIAIYALADRIIGSRTRATGRAAMFPVALIAEDRAESAADAERGGVPGAIGRLAVPALAIALELSAISSDAQHIPSWAYAAGVGYVALIVAVVSAFRRDSPKGRRRAISLLNSAAALATLPLLYLVSRSTNLRIWSNGRVVGYPWFPWWMALIAAVLAGWWWVGARGRGRSAVQLERAAVYVVAVPVLLFLLTAVLPSALGAFGAFDDAQDLAGAQLTFGHGLLPWRDIYLLHGLFEDDFEAQIGFGVFSHTRWGAVAGIDMFVRPVAFIVDYFFVLTFARSRRFVAWLCIPAALAGQLVVTPRFIFLPLLVVLLDAAIRTRGRWTCAALGAALVVESVVTAEIILMSACVLVVIVAFELATRPHSTPLRRAFPLLGWTVVGGIAAGVPCLVYLLMTRSLGAFIDFFRVFGTNHALWGAFPIQWSFSHDFQTSVEFLLPVVLMLATVLLVTWRLRARAGLSPRQWCLVAAAAFVASYFQKGLDRLDAGHVAEVFSVAIPLVLLSAIELLSALDSLGGRWLTSAARRVTGLVRRARVAPVTLVASLALVAGVPVITTSLGDNVAARHATSPTPAPAGLLGYTIPGSVDLAQVDALGRVLDLVAPSGPVFDFSNEPGITYFLLNRTPGADSYHVESAQTPLAQQLVISELERTRPRAAIFNNFDFGVPTLDGIPGAVRDYLISRYLLTHYRPYAGVDGQLVMVRSDLADHVPRATTLHLPGVTDGNASTYSGTYDCWMGDVGNFLTTSPLSSRGSIVLRPASGTPVTTTLEGWAVDDKRLAPAREVLAVVDGRVVGTTRPNLLRPDIEAYFRSPAVADSGFEILLDVPKDAAVKLFALNSDGTLSRIQPDPTQSLPSSLRSAGPLGKITGGPGSHYALERGGNLSGSVDSDVRSSATHAYSVVLPASTQWSSYAWATVSLTSRSTSTFVFTSRPGAQGYSVDFSALPGKRQLLLPLGSCSQPFGWGSSVTLLEVGESTSPTITLYR